MNNKPKRYRLLKDYRGFANDIIPAGTTLSTIKDKGWFGGCVCYQFDGHKSDTVVQGQIDGHPEWFEEITEPEKIDVNDLVGLLRDCVSRTWGNPSLTETQELFDDFLVEKKLVNISAKQMNRKITNMVNEILLDKKYTQQELDKAISEAYDRGRMRK